jgi:hypothetical protein
MQNLASADTIFASLAAISARSPRMQPHRYRFIRFIIHVSRKECENYLIEREMTEAHG